jgi:WD40 repeat protein
MNLDNTTVSPSLEVTFCIAIVLPDDRVLISVDDILRIFNPKTLEFDEEISYANAQLAKLLKDYKIFVSDFHNISIFNKNILETSFNIDGKINDVAQLSENELVIANDAHIEIWEISSTSCKSRFFGHAGGVDQIEILPDGRIISVGNISIKIWNRDIHEKTLLVSPEIDKLRFEIIDNDTIVTKDNKQIRVHYLQSGFYDYYDDRDSLHSHVTVLKDRKLAIHSCRTVKIFNIDSFPNGGMHCLIPIMELYTSYAIERIISLNDGRLSCFGYRRFKRESELIIWK